MSITDGPTRPPEVATGAADEDLDAVAPIRRVSVLRALVRTPTGVLAVLLVGLVVTVAAFGPLLSPHDPNDQNLQAILEPPGGQHLLGTDELGRDLLSRLISGARVSLVAALQAVALAVAVGLPFGLLAGYRGGWVDTLLSRLNDAVMSVPGLILALTVVAVLGPGLGKAMIAVGIIRIPVFYRVARAATLELRQETFVEASIGIGCPPWRVMWGHIFPNALPPLLVQVSQTLGYAIMAEASLSFLGLGVQPPTASWGSMLASASERVDQTHLLYGPGVAVIVAVLACTLFGDVLRDALADPSERTRRR